MSENLLVGLAVISVVGIAAQWLAWRTRLPSILVLLVFGFVAGPATDVIDPDSLLGDLLFPVVSISVAIILLEGGLSLRIGELKAIGARQPCRQRRERRWRYGRLVEHGR